MAYENFWQTPAPDTSANWWNTGASPTNNTPSSFDYDYEPGSLGSLFPPQQAQAPMAQPYQMPDNFIARQPSLFSGGDSEINPETGEAKDDGSLMSKFRNLSMPQVSQGQADLFKGLAGLYSAYQGNKMAGQLRQAAQTQDPFGAQRPFYQQQLRESYANPNAFMATPEARMQQDALRQQMERLDAKSGRRSQYGARAVQLAQAQAKQLADYRSGLQQAAGSGISPGNAATLQQAAAQAQMNAGAAPVQALSDIFTGQTPQYQAVQTRMKALEDAFAKKG